MALSSGTRIGPYEITTQIGVGGMSRVFVERIRERRGDRPAVSGREPRALADFIGRRVAPKWRRDGRELFYVDPKGRVIAVEVNTKSGFSIQSTAPLFQTPLPLPITQGSTVPYDVTADGQKFLMLVPVGQATTQPITVRLNWLPHS